MSNVRSSGIAGIDCHGSGYAAAPGAVRWLGLAAAPTFATMAMWTAVSAGQQDLLCISGHGSIPMNGMVVMYALMSTFHVPPWLFLIFDRRGSRAWVECRSNPVNAMIF